MLKVEVRRIERHQLRKEHVLSLFNVVIEVVAVHEDTSLSSMSMEIHIEGYTTLLSNGYCIRLSSSVVSGSGFIRC